VSLDTCWPADLVHLSSLLLLHPDRTPRIPDDIELFWGDALCLRPQYMWSATSASAPTFHFRLFQANLGFATADAFTIAGFFDGVNGIAQRDAMLGPLAPGETQWSDVTVSMPALPLDGGAPHTLRLVLNADGRVPAVNLPGGPTAGKGSGVLTITFCEWGAALGTAAAVTAGVTSASWGDTVCLRDADVQEYPSLSRWSLLLKYTHVNVGEQVTLAFTLTSGHTSPDQNALTWAASDARRGQPRIGRH
jgi:hypothetical protein